MTAVYKHGSRNDPSNYRPISVVPIIAKVLEKLVASQLNGYCEENQLLSPYQGAYRVVGLPSRYFCLLWILL